MSLHHLFIPHPHTHKKAPLLSWYALIVYILIFLFLQKGILFIEQIAPNVLGASSQITISEIVEKTNSERSKAGLPQLTENKSLDKAALAKANNMFEENYWAHYSPSGKDPWGFIRSSGYKFSYAGENLAKNFYTSGDTVKAWMDSSSHRDNILNSKYQEIGVAVAEGEINGQPTVLVVQMFGASSEPVAILPSTAPGNQSIPSREEASNVAGSSWSLGKQIARVDFPGYQPILTPELFSKGVAIFFIGFIVILLSLDLLVLKKRGVLRVSSHHIAHMGFLILTGTSVLTQSVGQVI